MQFSTAFCLVIQQYFERKLLFVNDGVLVNSIPGTRFRYMYTQVLLAGEFLKKYVPLLWVEVG